MPLQLHLLACFTAQLMRMIPPLLFAALVSVHCASSSPAPVAQDAPAACKSYYDALAGWSARCAAAGGGSFAATPAAVSACVATSTAPGVRFTPQRLAACAAAANAAPCNARDIEVQDCLGGPGTLAAEAPCGLDLQCESGTCILLADSSCGVCKARVALGGTCGNRDGRCAAGLACNANSCVAEIAKDGEQCAYLGDGPQCAEGLACLPAAPPRGLCGKLPAAGAACQALCAENLSCENKVCVLRLADGAPCTPATVCGVDGCRGPSRCVEGLACNDVTKTCTRVAAAKIGENCNFTTKVCPDSAYCADYDVAVGGTCKRLPARGEPCLADDPKCESGLVCVQNTCVAIEPAKCK
jgi:hypothetical protein